uniref:phosphoribosylaminoimidazolesuccinocarboxamide synthase n=1 Tax=uncultured organism TaxID=155900 RepID=M1P1T1_9ZZZZ|nr:phosphoribosylaminoimidazole-succinocarboxamide synthase [uncultured organism]
MKKLIRKGKVKEVYEVDEDRLKFFFTNNISVFDKIIPNDIPRKGETLCKTSSYWFKKCEELGIKTHFIDMPEDQVMEVRRFEVINDYDKMDSDTTNYRIPLEFIARYYVAGSLHDRIKKGKLDHEKLGFEEEPDYGEKLPEPYFEVTTKVEEIDRNLSKEEALDISGLTEEEYEEIKEAVFKIDELIEENGEKNGLLHVDGKKEFAMDENRDIILVDTFGIADEDRFWENDEYENGNFVQKSKEFVRQHYRKTGYHEDLMDARENGEEEPPIPPLPDDMVDKTSELYVNLMSRLTNGKFR